MATGLGFLGRGRITELLRTLAVHLAGAAAGGAALGALLGFVGERLGASRAPLPFVLVGTVLSLWLSRSSRRYPRAFGIRRQVPRSWVRRMRRSPLYFSWGFLLGTGVATAIPHSALVLLSSTQLVSGPVLGALAGTVFGFTREASVVYALLRHSDPQQTLGLVQSLERPAERANRVVSILGGAALVLVNIV
jgi:hypothetical protein